MPMKEQEQSAAFNAPYCSCLIRVYVPLGTLENFSFHSLFTYFLTYLLTELCHMPALCIPSSLLSLLIVAGGQEAQQ